MMAQGEVSVVVCSYTTLRWTQLVAAMESLRRQTVEPGEVVLVVDHNPELLARAARTFTDALVVENSGTRGLSDARNTGVSVSSGTIVAFLDDDAWANERWVEQLRRHYQDRMVLGVGGSATPDWEAERPRWFPEEFDWVVGCSYRGLPTTAAPVRNFLGCNMSFRRSAFGVAGGFDPGLGRAGDRPVGDEETEFCIRLSTRIPGALLVYEPAANVSHLVPAARARWRYFLSRCYSEGLSKAAVTRLAGASAGLATERRYVVRTLPAAIGRDLWSAIRMREPAYLRQAGAVCAGLLMTVAGYAVGSLFEGKRTGGLP
jgi:glycosyltransferase involved in cell wall biosynthesis